MSDYYAHHVVFDSEEYEFLAHDAMSEIVDSFCDGYATAMLWANCLVQDAETGDEFEDMHYAYISPGKWWEGIGIPFDDAIDFLAMNFDTLDSLPHTSRNYTHGFWECHGHDFALTRNGHGVGFWDRGYGDIGETLSDAARAYGESTLYVSSDPDDPTISHD